MSQDTRPLNCRFRLQDEGKPYPRSGCSACGKRITTGLGKACSVGVAASDTRIAELEAEVERLKAGPKVKPLEWARKGNAAKSITQIGVYRVYRTDDGYGCSLDSEELAHIGHNACEAFEGALNAAKAAAQKDYEMRILSALVQP